MDSLKKNNFIGGIEILITGIIWGVIGYFVKELSFMGATAALSAFFRVFFAFIFAAIVALIKYGPKSFMLTREQFIWCLIDGIVTQGLYNYVYNICVEKSGVTIAAVLLYTSPIFNAIISCIAFNEKISTTKKIILTLNMVGCMVAATGLDFTLKSVSIIGIIMGVLSGLFYGASPVLGKYANRNPHLFIVIAYNELFASIFMLIFIHPFSGIEIISEKMWLYGIMYGVVITGIAYIFYYDGVKRMTELTKIPVIASIETVVAALVGYLIYREPLNVYNYLGIVVVILSIILMSRANEKKIIGGGKKI